MRSWEDTFKLTKRYKREHDGKLPGRKTLYHGEKLGGWVNSQKTAIRKTKLDEEK